MDPERTTEILEELRRLGPEGVRAAEMLTAAQEQIDRPRTRAGNLVAYSIREALMSLLDLAGRPERTITNAGNRVVQSAADVRRDQAALDSLLDDVEQLAIALEGPGPHMTRLQTLITSLARRPVVRAEADLLDAYIVLIREVNTLHADVNFETAVDLHDRALTTIAPLFGPMSARLEEIDPLIAILEPTPQDVARLASLAGDARTLSYFFSRVEGVGWLRALASHQLMEPPVQGPWFAYGYLTKLAQSDPIAVGEWLRSQPRGQELHDHQAFLLIAIARDLGAPIADAVLHVAAGRTDDSRVLHQIVTYLSTLPLEAHANTAVIGLTKRALDGVTGRRAPADDTYLATGLLNIVVSGSRQGEAGRWLRILVAKMAAAYDHFDKTEVRTLERIDGLAMKPQAPVLDQFVAAIRDVARIAADQGMPTTDRIARLRRIPLPLGSRLIAAHLLETVDSDIAAALTVLTEDVTHRGPMPETLALLSELTSLHPPGLEEDMLRSLGHPPGSDEIAALDDAADFPKAWTHAYGWLISMPTGVRDAWTAANARVESRWGRASANGLLWPKPTVTAVRPTRVLEHDESAPREPLQAAARIAEWTPETEFGGATRYDTGRELQDLVSKDPLRWVSQPQVAIIEALRDPIYVEQYFRALAEHADQLADHGRDILDAIALAHGKVTSDHTSGEPERGSWTGAVSAGVELIGALASAGHDLGSGTDLGWEIIERAIRRRTEESTAATEVDAKPLERAIYRASMRALDVAFVYANATTGDDAEPSRLLAILDEVLRVDPPDGLHARAIISRRLPWLRWEAAEWTETNWSRLVGDDAPAGLGPFTFDQYLEWGAPDRPLLSEHWELYQAAFARVPDHARRHVLHAMIWEVEGYSPDIVLETLATAGDRQVADAIQWLAFGVFHQSAMPIERAIEFLRLSLARNLSPATYEAIGWLSRVERVDGDTWLDVTRSAAQATHGRLVQAKDVADRAATFKDDPRAIRIAAALLAADLELWYLDDVGRVGLQLLKSQNPATQEARAELREELLKREFFDAR